MNTHTRPVATDTTIGETVKRKNIGDETVRESQLEMDNEKNERLSETIFMLMLELKLAKREIKRLQIKVAEPGGLSDISLIGGDAREKLEHYRETNERIERENSNLRFQLDKLKNLEIENKYYKENFEKVEELYLLEQQKRKFLEAKLGELNAHEISMIEETFEEKFKYTRTEEHYQHTEYTEENYQHNTQMITSNGETPIQSGLGQSGNISLLSKNIQKKVRQHPQDYNLRAKQMEREVYILSKEVDRLNVENQKFIEENIILAQKLRNAGVEAPDFLSDKFASGGTDINGFGSELVEPTEIEIPEGKTNFPQLLSNDNTFFLKERIEKLESEAEIYVETIKEMEDLVDEVKRKNIKLDNALRLNRKDNFRESVQLERENQELKDQLDNIKSLSKPKSQVSNSMPNGSVIEKFESERRNLKTIITQKQREIIFYKQVLKDHNVDYENPNRKQSRPNMQDTIEEEEEIFYSRHDEPEENEVNSGFPGFTINKKRANNNVQNSIGEAKSGDPNSATDIMVTPSFKEINRKTGAQEDLMNKIRQMENQVMKLKSNHELEKNDLQGELLKNEEDLKLLLRRNGDLEESLERLREKQRKIKEKLRNQVHVGVQESEADEELKRNLKNSLLQQNLEKMKNISASLLNQKEEEYQREMRKLKLTMQNLDNANLSEKNNELLQSLRKKKRNSELPKDGVPKAELEKLQQQLEGVKTENKLLQDNLEVYKDEVENMVNLLGKIENQVETLEKENDELTEDLDTQNKQLDSERESYKDLKEQYLDQIELNNKRNKEIIMLKNQVSRKNDIGEAGKGLQDNGGNEKAEMLEAEVMDKNEVINMLKGQIRDKENQKSHLSQKIRDLEVLFRDMERENQELRKLKEVGGSGEGDAQNQLYVQIIRQQQLELKKWRASQLSPEEVPKLQLIIQDQHKEILQLKSKLEAEGKPIPQVNQAQLMEVIRKQQAEINRLKALGGSSQEELGDAGAKEQQLVAIIKQQQEELKKWRSSEADKPQEGESKEKIQQLMKLVKQHQMENEALRRKMGEIDTSSQGESDKDKDAKLMQYVQVIKQQRDEINKLKLSQNQLADEVWGLKQGQPSNSEADQLRKENRELKQEHNQLMNELSRVQQQGQPGSSEMENELRAVIDSKSDEIFFLKKKLNEGGRGNNVQSGAPADSEKYIGIITGQNQELETLKHELAKAQSEANHLQMLNQNSGSNPNVKKMMEIIQKQQDEMNAMRLEGKTGANNQELMAIIQRQQEELNGLRLVTARNDKVEDMILRLKEKQDQINRLRMDNAGQQTNEGLIQMVKDKQEEINKMRINKGNQGSVDRLMELVKEKQEEINELRLNRKGKENNEKLMKVLREKQEEINDLRFNKAKSENSEELKRIIQEKQQEINRLKSVGGQGQGMSSEQVRKEIELQNEIGRLKPFESRSQQLDQIVNDLERKLFEYQTKNPELANTQRLGDIIKEQQQDLERLKSQLGGRDWVKETEQLRGVINKLHPENERLKLNLKEIQSVNKSNKEIYLHEKETLVREIHTLKREVEIREERIVETTVINNNRTEELETELRELSDMVNNVVGTPGQYEAKYREQKAINTNWRKKAEDFDNLKQLYEQKLLENEAKIIKMNTLELKIFVLLSHMKTMDPNFISSKSKPVIYQGTHRFQKKTANTNVQGGFRKSSPVQSRGTYPRSSSNNVSNPLQKRLTRDSFRQGSPSPSPSNGSNNRNFMVVTNNDGTFTKKQVNVSNKTVSRNVQKASYTSTSVNETRTREVSSSSNNRPSQGTGINRIISRNEKFNKKVDIFSSNSTQSKKVYGSNHGGSYTRPEGNRSPSPYSGQRHGY